MKKPIQQKSVNLVKQTTLIYWSHVKQNLWMFLIIFVSIPAAALCLSTMTPYYLSQAIGQLAASQGDTSHVLIVATGWGIAGVILNAIGFQLLARHEAFMNSSLITSTAKSILEKDYTFFSNVKIGALTTKFNDFVRSYATLKDLLIVRTLSFVISIGVGSILIALQSPKLALMILVFLLFIALQIRIMLRIRMPYRNERKYIRSSITGDVADIFTNNLIVKTFAQEQPELKSLTKKTENLMKIAIKDFSLIVSEGSARQLITTFTQITAIIFAIHEIKNGSMTIASAIFALTFIQRIAAQIFTLGEMINGYDTAFLEAAPMTEILLQPNKTTDSPSAKKLVVKNGAITFCEVGYAYEEGNTAVDDFQYTVAGGKRIGVVGHSGAGKTTITRLLLRFDDVTSGEIEIDGQNIANVTQQSLRESIAYVPQEPLLFHRSIAENIGYGSSRATLEEITQAAKQANAHEFIKNLPNGYETIVGERGAKLSGGQRQRIAIARAVLKNAPILLLDEATSALDSESEKLIQNALEKLMKNRTTIVIAHRLSTIQKMDRIIVMKDGSISEEGPHAELIKNNGVYANLWNHQSGGFIED